MSQFIDIRNDANDPMMVGEKIVLMTETQGHNTARFPGSKQLSIHFANGDSLIVTDTEWRLSADGVAQAAATRGQSLMEIPYEWGDGPATRCFIDPAALSAITISDATLKPGKTEPSAAFIASVKGRAYVQSKNVPVSIMTAFMKAAEAANPQLRTVPAHVARDRNFYPSKDAIHDPAHKASLSAYDPADVILIHGTGFGVKVKHNGAMDLDFEIEDAKKDHLNIHLDRMLERIVRMRGNTQAAYESVMNDNVLTDRVLKRCFKYHKRAEARIEMDFARVVAKDCPQLRTLPGLISPFYTRGQNVTYAVPSDNSLYFRFHVDSPEGKATGTGTRATFRDEKTARAVLRDLPRLMR